MCHLIYDLFGGGISLGIELPESECVCVARMDGKWIAKTHKNKAHLRRAIFFSPQKCQFIVHICKLAIIFFVVSKNVLLPPPPHFYFSIHA